MMQCVADGSMALEDAEHVIDNIEYSPPIASRIGYLRCLAALRAKWAEEGDRRLPNGPPTLRQVLVNACVPSRVEWLLNYRRFANTISRARVDDMAVGTTSNEALHRELNSIFDLVHEIYQATLLLKLRIVLLHKGIPHYHACQGDLLRQREPRRILSRAIHNITLWDEAEWVRWCESFVVEDRIRRRRSGLSEQRLVHKTAVKRWVAKRPSGVRRKIGRVARRQRRTIFRMRTGVRDIWRRPASSDARVLRRPAAQRT